MYEGMPGSQIYSVADDAYTWELNAAEIQQGINNRMLFYQASPFGHYGSGTAGELNMVGPAYGNRRFLGFFIPPPQR